MLGGEETCDLELDRNTVFRESVPDSKGNDHSVTVIDALQMDKSVNIPVTEKPDDSPVDTIVKEEPEEPRELVNMPLKLLGPRFQPAPMTSSAPFFQPPPFVSIPDPELRTQVYTTLLSHLNNFPLIKRDEIEKGYTIADTREMWDSWSVGKQQACEWARARHLHKRCCVGDVFFTARRVLRFCRAIAAVPDLPRGDISFARVDSTLIRDKNEKRIPDSVGRSDIEYVWQVVGQLKPSSVPEVDWEEGSDWVSGGIKFYTAVVGFVDRVMSVGRANGVGAGSGAGELARAIRAHGQELAFLDGGIDEDIRSAMET
jgi:hypothetical protein